MNRRNAWNPGLAGIAIFALGLAPLPGQAQEKYPERPVRLVVPFPAGEIAKWAPIGYIRRLDHHSRFRQRLVGVISAH